MSVRPSIARMHLMSDLIVSFLLLLLSFFLFLSFSFSRVHGTLYVPVSVGLSIHRSVRQTCVHATYGDRPCFNSTAQESTRTARKTIKKANFLFLSFFLFFFFLQFCFSSFFLSEREIGREREWERERVRERESARMWSEKERERKCKT